MLHPTSVRPGRLSTRSLIVLVMVLGVLSLIGGEGTLAYFTSSATSIDNVFTTGTVALRLTDANEVDEEEVVGSFGTTLFKPGQTIAGFITVKNTGTLAFDYGLKYTGTNSTGTLWETGGNDPTLHVYQADAPSSCTSVNAAGAKSGLTSVLDAGAVKASADNQLLESDGPNKRPLAAGDSEHLCLVVAWANSPVAGAENGQMGASGEIELTFDAR